MKESKGQHLKKGPDLTITLHSWRDGKDISMQATTGERVIDVVRRAGFHVDGVLVMVEGEPVPIDEELTKALASRVLTVIRVASGG